MSRMIVFACIVVSWVTVASASAAEVRVERVPHDGKLPHVQVDEEGVVHMVYLRGTWPGPGDIYYVRKAPGEAGFSEPMRVNSQAGSGFVAGGLRAPHLALGREGRMHVAWMGSPEAEPKAPGDTTPMLYSRLDDAGTAFEPQRNVVQHGTGLDGGGTVAADADGRVYVIWHGFGPDNDRTEAGREVYVALSTDDGESFARETAALPRPLGVCVCCGINARADDQGTLHILFRSATSGTQRGTWLLSSRDGGRRFTADEVESWEINACMMSTAAFAESSGRLAFAWETEGRVSFATTARGERRWQGPHASTGRVGGQKHPALAINGQGQMLLAWVDGGHAAWQVYEADGTPVGEPGHEGGVPADHRVRLAAWAEPDGTFVIAW